MYVIIIIIISQSCNNFFWGVKDLGNNFAIIEADKDDISIQYCFSGDCTRSGLYVVPSKIVEYNKNANWIIAKSINGSDTSFWIIDKKFFPDKKSEISALIKRNIRGPLDSISFYNEVKNKKINIELKRIN